MRPIGLTDIGGRKPMTAIATTLAELDEGQIRVDLAAAFRLAGRVFHVQ